MFFLGCSYQFVEPSQVSVRVPYVEGDRKGIFTNQIIEKISQNPFFAYQERGGRFRVKIALTNFSQGDIGYRREVEKISGALKKNLRPIEGRLSATASIELIEESSGKVVWGPVFCGSEVDFDYVEGDSFSDLSFVDPKGERKTALTFSLGQLEPIESASEAAMRPLFDKLSQKVVEILMHHLAISDAKT